MANNNAPMGLVPVRHRSGAPYNGAANAYYVPASYGTALFIGDVVAKTGTSNTAAVTAPGAGSFAIGTLPEINRALVGTNKITGVIVGFAPNPSTLDKVYNPASTAAVVYVADDPDLMFEIQADGALNAVDVGLNACTINTQSGNVNTGLSGTELDTGTTTAPATTTALQLKIMRILNRVDNEAGSTRTRALVMINNHTDANATIGV
jgi:hypothetical protein